MFFWGHGVELTSAKLCYQLKYAMRVGLTCEIILVIQFHNM